MTLIEQEMAIKLLIRFRIYLSATHTTVKPNYYYPLLIQFVTFCIQELRPPVKMSSLSGISFLWLGRKLIPTTPKQ